MKLPVVNHQDYVAKINDDNKFPIRKFGEEVPELYPDSSLPLLSDPAG